ncbi:MAG: cytochrome c [Chloroflexota bacterium]|jgi:mono/diheme cytochrome c family protein
MRYTKLIIIFVLFSSVLLLAGCGGGNDSAAAAPAADAARPAVASGDAEAGKVLFQQSCASCHGPEALGISGLGKDMTTSTFIQELSDEELLAFVKNGRSTSDPLNTTGVDMPPKGGNPALTDAQLLDIIAFIHSVQK